jgi:hypothetical protein
VIRTKSNIEHFRLGNKWTVTTGSDSDDSKFTDRAPYTAQRSKVNMFVSLKSRLRIRKKENKITLGRKVRSKSLGEQRTDL